MSIDDLLYQATASPRAQARAIASHSLTHIELPSLAEEVVHADELARVILSHALLDRAALRHAGRVRQARKESLALLVARRRHAVPFP
jgi:hypothetical protein